MLMTEEEATTKWCPFAEEALGKTSCVASGCMAWRWGRAKETKAYLDAVKDHMQKTGDTFNKATQIVYAEIGSTFEQTEGYCGLAGKPE